MNVPTDQGPDPFVFPPEHSFPPFYTLQPNTTTRHGQLTTWSALIQSYCRHRRIFKLSLSDALQWDLFHNRELDRRIGLKEAREIIDFMRTAEGRAEWADSAKSSKADGGGGGTVCWIWWRRVDEWAELLERWVADTGQKNTVLTLYELAEGEMTRGTEFHGMPREVLQMSLNVLVKRGKAQVFGNEDQQGVKFF